MDQAIATTKMQAAQAYAERLEGRGQQAKLDGLEQWLRALTGEPRRDPAPAQAPPRQETFPFFASGGTAGAAQSPLQARFWPFEQVNTWYCGPATAQSILRFLGANVSKAPNGDTGKREELTGKPEDDQRILASDFWLSTDRYHGTNWGPQYMPFTLNAWRGTRWYVQAPTENAGGTLTKQQALAAIKYDTDRAYPVAENVLYSNRTYYPAGFWPGVTYSHWDTVYGHYKVGNRQVVQVGQVYHDNRLPYDRFQDIDWDTHWTAIGIWYGIVW